MLRRRGEGEFSSASSSANDRQRPQKIVVNEEDPNFERKLDLVTAGGRPFVREHMLTRITRENCMIIINYIPALQTEVSPSGRYRIDTIFKLKQLAEFHNPNPSKI
jgi:hypothetical protein